MLVSTKPKISFTPTSQYSHFVFIIKNTSPHSFISLWRHLLVNSDRALYPHLALSITIPPCSSHACHAFPFVVLLFPLPGIAPSLFSWSLASSGSFSNARLTWGVFLLCSNRTICKYIIKSLSCFTACKIKLFFLRNQYSYAACILPNACSTTLVVCICLPSACSHCTWGIHWGSYLVTYSSSITQSWWDHPSRWPISPWPGISVWFKWD